MHTRPSAVGLSLRSHADLGDDPRAARVGRAHAEATLLAWQLERLVEDVVLTVSELVGNALRHGSPPVGLTLNRLLNAVSVEVHDNNPVEPPLRDPSMPGDASERGRGLAIVSALADSLACDRIAGDGKIVRATFSTADRATPPLP